MNIDIAIKQKHDFGCGIACVANILDISYDKTLFLFNKQKASERGFICKEIIRVLLDNNKKYEYKYIKPKYRNKIYQNNVIVFIKRSKKYPAGHYLCRSNNKWMDSWINFPKDQNIKNAKAGFRKRLPGKAIYAILPINN